MDNAHWFVLTGGLLLFIGVTSSVLRRLPVTTAILYLAIGILVGPTGLNLFHFNPLKQSQFLEALTEWLCCFPVFGGGQNACSGQNLAMACTDSAGFRFHGGKRRPDDSVWLVCAWLADRRSHSACRASRSDRSGSG